jgi:hypothetical protein
MDFAKNCQYHAHIFITLVSNADHVVILGGGEGGRVSYLFLKKSLFFQIDGSIEKHKKIGRFKDHTG